MGKNMTGSFSRSKGFTLVEIMIVVAIIALLTAIAIPYLLRARITGNEASARGTLKTISTALETYALSNGTYPLDPAGLLGQVPPYLSKDYFSAPLSGYTYTPTLDLYTYTIVAAPLNSSYGNKTFTMATGGVLTESP